MSTPLSDDFLGQRQRRIDNREALRALGIDVYPAKSQKELATLALTTEYEKYEGKSVTVAGRIMSWRTHGKIVFTDLADVSGSVQVAIRADDVSTAPAGFLTWDMLRYIDVGDFLEVAGTVGKTQVGQISLFATSLRLLSKSIRPLPNTFDDKEKQFRRRYIDFVMNPAHRERFIRKAKFWSIQRRIMEARGFIEVETPVLEAVTGGADAKPFVTHHNQLDQDFYLRISTELYQKRLIGAGMDKIYTLGPNFRNEGLSDEHLQEYYQLEWYWAYANYENTMSLVREVITETAKEIYGKTTFSTRGHVFDLAGEWKTIDYVETIREHHGIDIFTAKEEDMKRILVSHGVDLSDGQLNRVRMIDNLWKIVRKTVSGPAFLVNHPAFMSPLAKTHPEDPRITERFQVVIAGSELGNGYSEINDPEYQLSQFLAQQQLRDAGDDEAQMLDIDYVEMLEYGMPPVSGYGHSERIFWFLEDCTAREGTIFPLLRHETDELTKRVYPRLFAKKPTHKADPKTKYLIFDFDGVLADTYEVYLNSLVKFGYAKDLAGAQQHQLNYFTKKPEHNKNHVQTSDEAKLDLDLVQNLGKYNMQQGFPLFTEFIDEIKKIGNAKLAVVSSGSQTAVIPKSESTGLPFTHILCWEDHRSKEEKIEIICKDWGINVKETYYFTDTLVDVYELENLLDRKKIIGCAWGWLGYDWLAKELPDSQILKAPQDLAVLFSSVKESKPAAVPTVTTNDPLLNKETAIKIMNDHIANPGLRKHCLAVGAAMAALARHFGSNEKLWEVAGILHDADWEESKDDVTQHTRRTVEWIQQFYAGKNADDEKNLLIRVILAHNYASNSEPEPVNEIENSLLCCDELTGLIVANALIMPSKKLADVSVESVIKKMNSKSFAAAVDRAHIRACEARLGIPLQEFVGIVLSGMQSQADELGL